MSLGTYAALQTSIADWLARPGDATVAAIAPDLIALFEARFIRKMLKDGSVLQMEGRSTATMSGQFLARPTDWIGQRSLRITSTDPVQALTSATPDYIAQMYGSSATGRPKVYCILDSEYMWGPAPDSGYTVENLYYKFAALSSGNTSNWLLASYPDLYLFGSLLEAEGYNRNFGAQGTWKSRVDEATEDLLLADQRARFGGSPTMRGDTGNP